MTSIMVIGSMVLLSVVTCLPEIAERIDGILSEAFIEVKIPIISLQHIAFVEDLELTDDWFIRDPEPKRNVWRLKNAKCGWSPLPPGGWKSSQLVWA